VWLTSGPIERAIELGGSELPSGGSSPVISGRKLPIQDGYLHYRDVRAGNTKHLVQSSLPRHRDRRSWATSSCQASSSNCKRHFSPVGSLYSAQVSTSLQGPRKPQIHHGNVCPHSPGGISGVSRAFGTFHRSTLILGAYGFGYSELRTCGPTTLKTTHSGMSSRCSAHLAEKSIPTPFHSTDL
jgi:hypothetical protein